MELEEIYLYIKEYLKEPKIAKRIIREIKNKIKSLENFPQAHQLIKKSKNVEYRKHIIKNYIIIYKINLIERIIYILHIYNQKEYYRF